MVRPTVVPALPRISVTASRSGMSMMSTNSSFSWATAMILSFGFSLPCRSAAPPGMMRSATA